MFNLNIKSKKTHKKVKNNKTQQLLSLSMVSLACLTAYSSSIYADSAQTAQPNKSKVLTFAKAISAAQKNDPWLTGNVHKQQAIESMSKVANTLADPKVSINMANLPVNGFDFGQEGMTQLKVGIAQMFPRGDSLAIKSRQLRIKSEAYPLQRIDRKAKVAVTVGSLWLEAYRVQQSIALIESNRSLFEQLADVAEASYSSALGKTRQQDIVRAQLELTRLDDRLDKLAQQKSRYEGQLSQWTSNFLTVNKTTVTEAALNLHNIQLSVEIPQIDLLNTDLVYNQQWLQPEHLVGYFSQHPSVLAIDKKIKASKTGISLAKQKYQPEWAVNASYGYRADDPMGRSRADLFSVGVTFDLPLFTENRQDMEVKSAVSTTEAIKTEKVLLLRKLLAGYSSAKGRFLRLNERQALYREKLLPQIHDQAEASLTAYTNDDGDFSEVVRARIAVLNAEIDELVIDVEQQKLILELNYLFISNLATRLTETSMNVINNSQYAVVNGEQ